MSRTEPPLEIVVAYDYGHVNGGAAKVAIDGALGLAARGHRVTFFAPVGPPDPRLAPGGVDVVVMDQSDLIGDPNRVAAAVRGIWNAKAARRLADVLKRVDPRRGVVYQHGWSKALSPASQRVIAASGLASVHHLHEYFAACPNGGFYDYRAGRNCTLAPMSPGCVVRNCDVRNYGHKLYRVARHGALTRPGRFARNLRHVVHISELQRRTLAPWLPEPARSTYAPNPVGVEDRGPAPIRADAPFLFVGRFSPEKGAHLAAAAATAADTKIDFVGAGEDEPMLRAAAPRARFHGWLDAAGVVAAMRRARALVFPSLWRECQPLTVLEALANGLPAIVSRDCAAAEFVADEETGLHVVRNDAMALAAAMQRLADLPEARRLGAEAHRRYWAAPHSLDRHLDAVEAALRGALDDDRPA